MYILFHVPCSIIQAVLGCLPIPDPSLNQEATKIMRIADRVCKCKNITNKIANLVVFAI